MQGKKILMIGAGRDCEGFDWDATNGYGIKIILVDKDKDSYAREKALHFIHYDYTDHSQDEIHANNIIKHLSTNNLLPVNGCCAILEANGPLSARICTKLKLNGAGQNSAIIAGMKSLTHKKLITRTANIPHFPRTYLYASPCVYINSRKDIYHALNKVGQPAVLELEYGSIKKKIVKSNDQTLDEYDQIQSTLQEKCCHTTIRLGKSNSIMLMHYFEGTEHNVSIMIFCRRIVAAFISDNGVTRQHSCKDTGAYMSTCLPEEKKAQLITAAYQCCTEIGLENGIFNVKIKLTLSGPKLIKIKPQMRKLNQQDWIKACYGVDMLFCTYLISSGIRPILPKYNGRLQQ